MTRPISWISSAEFLHDGSFALQRLHAHLTPAVVENLKRLQAETDDTSARIYTQPEVVRAMELAREPVLQALTKAEAFIAGFEGDEIQGGVDELLAEIRAAIAAGSVP